MSADDSGPRSEETTRLLHRFVRGDRDAGDALIPRVYDELHDIAQRYLHGEREGHTLQPTALVNEAWLRLVDLSRIDFRDKAHFLAMAARLMRRVLVDTARQRQADKRGGTDRHREPLHDVLLQDKTAGRQYEVLAIDAALTKLNTLHQRHAALIEMRFFGGMTFDQCSEALGVTARTLKNDWRMARAWLLNELRDGSG